MTTPRRSFLASIVTVLFAPWLPSRATERPVHVAPLSASAAASVDSQRYVIVQIISLTGEAISEIRYPYTPRRP